MASLIHAYVFVDFEPSNQPIHFYFTDMDKCAREDCLVIPLAIWAAFNLGFVSIATVLAAYVEVIIVFNLPLWFMSRFAFGSCSTSWLQ